MQTSPIGRLVIWFGLGILLVGLTFSNGIVLVSAALLFVLFLVEGVRFRRAIHTIRNSISIESQLPHIEVTAGDELKIETVVKNTSSLDFRIIYFEHMFPSQLVTKPSFSETWIQRHGKGLIVTASKATVPGRFTLTKSVIVFETGMRLFRHKVEWPDHVMITVRPLARSMGMLIDATSMFDLTVDRLHYGPGTDLAGIRPSTFSDDFHRIDWKVTARTGKLMTRECYLEKDPTIMLMVDVSSSMKTVWNGTSALNSIVDEAGKVSTVFRSGNPVGLILFDEKFVITSLSARQGVEHLETIVRVLIDQTEPIHNVSRPVRQETRSYASLVKDTYALEAELLPLDVTKREWPDSFARTLLPFFQRAKSKHLRKVRRLGAFAAFEDLCNLPEPVLAVAITDGQTNLDALYEGAKNAALSDHRVVLVILTDSTVHRPPDELTDLREFGIHVHRIRANQLWRTIDAATFEMNRIRRIHAAK